MHTVGRVIVVQSVFHSSQAVPLKHNCTTIHSQVDSDKTAQQ